MAFPIMLILSALKASGEAKAQEVENKKRRAEQLKENISRKLKERKKEDNIQKFPEKKVEGDQKPFQKSLSPEKKETKKSQSTNVQDVTIESDPVEIKEPPKVSEGASKRDRSMGIVTSIMGMMSNAGAKAAAEAAKKQEKKDKIFQALQGNADNDLSAVAMNKIKYRIKKELEGMY